MMTSDNILDVDEINFEYEVVAYSKNSPVLVDFWAEWCQPCKVLTPLLEHLVIESEGTLRLARVNVDRNPNLAQMYSVRSIPTVKAFSQGQVVAEFVGVQSEERLREFLSKITPPSAVDLDIEKGENLLSLGKWQEAQTIFSQVLEVKPESPKAQLGFTRALLAQGNATRSLQILKEFPSSREYANAELLIPYAKTLSDFEKDQLPQENNLDATFKNSIRLASHSNLPAALDGLLDILKQDKQYRNGLAREVVISLLEILGNEVPISRQYRAELTSILF